MANLTPKQENFCKAIADGMGQADAYRHAYDCENSSLNTIRVKASAMMRRDKIRDMVNKLKAQLEEKQLWSREDSVITLIEVITNDPSAKASDRIKAVGELNKMHGWQSATVDLKNSDGSMRPKKDLSRYSVNDLKQLSNILSKNENPDT